MTPLALNRYMDEPFPVMVALIRQKTFGTNNCKLEQHRLLKSTCFNTVLGYCD